MIDRERALAIQKRAMRDWIAMVGDSAPDSRLLEPAGVAAAVVPAVPERSISNSVTYGASAELEAALDELAVAYEEAGVFAWTVWVPELDRETITLLERAGHSFDGQPMAMVLELDRYRPPDAAARARREADVELETGGEMPTLGRINDAAYGFAPGAGMGAMFARSPERVEVRLSQARVDGEPVAVMATIDHEPVEGAGGPDCGIYFVATDPEHRGRGLASGLMDAALTGASERGCETSSLQASALGEPVYAALGYERCFRMHMYERRRQR